MIQNFRDGLPKLKSFCTAEGPINKMKKQSIERKEKFETIYQRELISKKLKELSVDKKK